MMGAEVLMPTFTLHRDRALTEEEWSRLPRGSVAVNDGTDTVVRADVDGPLLELLSFCASLARCIPDARLLIRQSQAVIDVAAGTSLSLVETLPALASEHSAPMDVAMSSAVSQDGPPMDPALMREDPWDLLDRGDLIRAEARFALGYELDMVGRDRVRELFNSTDPATCALGCRLSGYTNWKSFVTTLRRAVDHADVRVRRDAVTAIGKLAGPAMSQVIEEKLKDPSPDVVAAARKALITISAREPARVKRR